MTLMQRRRALMGWQKKLQLHQYTINFQGNVVGTIDGNTVSVSSSAASNTDRVRWVFNEAISLHQGDTLSVKVKVISGGPGKGYIDSYFLSGNDTLYVAQNGNGQQFFSGHEYTYTATADITTTKFWIRQRNGNVSFNPPLVYYVEFYKNEERYA